MSVIGDCIHNPKATLTLTGDSNIVDVYIRYLRHKIDDRYHIKTIHTIRSVGYLFNYEEDEE